MALVLHPDTRTSIRAFVEMTNNLNDDDMVDAFIAFAAAWLDRKEAAFLQVGTVANNEVCVWMARGAAAPVMGEAYEAFKQRLTAGGPR
jgi:hypothetical protein